MDGRHSTLLTLLTGVTSVNLFLTPSDLFSLFPSVVACTRLLESELLGLALGAFLLTSGWGFCFILYYDYPLLLFSLVGDLVQLCDLRNNIAGKLAPSV